MHQAPAAASKMVPLKLTFSPLSRHQIEADFSKGHITSDAGLVLLREVDRQHRLTQRPAGTAQPFWRCWCDRQPVNYIVGIARNQRPLPDGFGKLFMQVTLTTQMPPCQPVSCGGI